MKEVIKYLDKIPMPLLIIVLGFMLFLFVILRWRSIWRGKWRRYVCCKDCTYWFWNESQGRFWWSDGFAEGHFTDHILKKECCPKCGCSEKKIKKMRHSMGKWRVLRPKGTIPPLYC